MTSIHRFSLVLWMTATVAGQPSTPPGGLTDPKEILTRAQSAAKKVKLASYRAEYIAEGWVSEFVPNVEGTVTVGDDTQQGVERFKCKVKITPKGSSEPLEFEAGCNGDEYQLADAKTKTVHRDMDPAVLGAHNRNIRRVVMTEFGVREPFKSELEAKELELRDPVKIAGEECYEIKADAGRPPVLVWWISKTDYLPRQLRRIHKNPEGQEGITQLTILDLKPDPKTDKDPFALEVPEGFKKTDEFAP
jgi:hypothetical protein